MRFPGIVGCRDNERVWT